MSLHVDISDTQLRKALAALGHIPDAVPKATARAINRAIVAANTEATKQIRGTYVVKAKTIKAAKFIKQKASASSLAATIEATGRPIPLGAFKTKPRRITKRRPKNPLFVQVKQGGGGTVYGAFVAGVRTGHESTIHTGVFQRTKGNASLPIKTLYGPSVPQMLGNLTVYGFVEKRAREVLDERLEHEINVILRGVVK